MKRTLKVTLSAIAILFLNGCVSSTPTEVTEKFFNATVDRNHRAMYAYSTPHFFRDSLRVMFTNEEEILNFVKIDVVEEKIIDEKNATVSFVNSIGILYNAKLKKEKSTWKIDSI